MIKFPWNRKSALSAMILTFVALSLLLSAALSFTIIKSTSAQLESRTKIALKADQQGFLDLYDQRRLIGLREGMERRAAILSDQTFIFMLLNRDGTRLGGNIESWPTDLSRNATFENIELKNRDGRIGSYIGLGQELRGGFGFMVARSTDANDQVVANQILLALALTSILTVISGGVGFVMSRRIIRQINAINSVARNVERGFLNERVSLIRQENEFRDLAININQMLEKISSNQLSMNTLSENLAHELRTPLNRVKKTIYQLSTEVGLDQPAVQKLVDTVGQDVDATMQTFDAVLEIVTTNQSGPDKTRFETIDLVGLLDELLVLFEPVGEERKLSFSVRMPAHGYVFGERQLLLQMISNVIENALKFSVDGGTISIDLYKDGANLKVRIENDSDGLLDDIDEIAFTQFQRGANAQEKAGYGLGLPLVKAIATRHDFEVSIFQEQSRFGIEFCCPLSK